VANTFAHGKLVAVQVGGVYFASLGISWKEVLSDLQDITYTRSGGATFRNSLPGYNFATGDIDFVWDSSNNPLSGAISMIPGTLLALIFTPDGTNLCTMSAWSGEFNIASAGPTKGPVKCSVSYTTEGSYTRA
jgi:hypothetical protein